MNESVKLKVRKVDLSHDEFIAGIAGQLTETQTAYYLAVLLKFYSEGGPIDNDAAGLARIFKGGRASTAKWAISQLIEKGKIQEVDGKLTQRRAEKELQNARHRMQVAVEKGSKGGRPRTEHDSTMGAPRSDDQADDKHINRIEKAGVFSYQKLSPPTTTITTTESKPSPNSVQATAKLMFGMWNEYVEEYEVIKPARTLTRHVRELLTARFEDECGGDIGDWRRTCYLICKSSFCRGENDKGWIADLSWVLQPGKITKVLDGAYDDRPTSSVSTTHSAI